ncbi:MAG: hypothetical protein RIR96_603 [Bacteroidota bacterium]
MEVCRSRFVSQLLSMPIISELFQIESIQSILKEEFKNNTRKWEQVSSESEDATIRDGYYWIKNKTKSRWNYYKTKTKLNQKQDFMIESDFELVEKDDAYGHFGLVWGFDESREFVNRFTVSANGTRTLIMHFEKDHKRTFHRFHTRNAGKINLNQKIRLSIIKIGSYYHFLVNKKKIYIAHESMFCYNGPFIGYYIEPGLFVKSDYLEVKKMKTKPLLVKNGLDQILK